MTKRQRKILEAAFEREIDAAFNGVPLSRLLQIENADVRKLAADGYLEFVETTDPNPRFPLKVKGYVLTVRGHIAYSQSCR